MKKNFDRLIAFGCSNTFGHGLNDCVRKVDHGPGPHPSNDAWPAILARKMNIDVIINKAIPGASNKLICKTILDFEFREKDLTVIGWTYPQRSTIFTDKGDIINLCLSKTKRTIDKVYRTHLVHERNFAFDSFLQIGMAVNHLNQLGIRNSSIIANDSLDICRFTAEFFDQPVTIPNILDIDYRNILDRFGRAKDRFHPSEESHKKIAEEIYNKIGNVNDYPEM